MIHDEERDWAEERAVWDEVIADRKAEIAHAREVDTEVARLYGLYHDVAGKIAPLRKEIERIKSAKALRYLTDDQRTIRIASYQAKIAALQAEAKPLLEAARAYDTEHYKDWNRFFLVQHIHGSMHCSSFRPTTRVGWLPDVSGLTEREAVEAHGTTLCTICFPSAPTALTTPKPDPSVCEGSGSNLDRSQPHRVGFYSGNWGTCPVCGAEPAVTKTFKLMKHKTKGA